MQMASRKDDESHAAENACLNGIFKHNLIC